MRVNEQRAIRHRVIVSLDADGDIGDVGVRIVNEAIDEEEGERAGRVLRLNLQG